LRISARFNLGTVLLGILAAAAGLILVFSYRHVLAAVEKMRVTDEIVEVASFRGAMRDEYLRDRVPRALAQWRIATMKLQDLIEHNAQLLTSPEERQALARLRTHTERLRGGFLQLLESEKIQAGLDGEGLKIKRRALLQEQLSISVREQMSSALSLSRLARESLIRSQKLTLILMIALLLILAASAIIYLFMMGRIVLRPIRFLQRATGKIGGGDLDHVIPDQRSDEFGELYESFDQMRRRIKEGNEALGNELSLKQEALKEKEIMLKEIHHRVKNNLQVVSSLLNMQSNVIDDKRLVEIFKESQNRVRSMALIHEKLYRSQNMAKVDFANYLDSLVRDLLRAYKVGPADLDFEANLEEVSISVDVAVPLGLIINELVTNSLRHGVPKAAKGKIKITLEKKADDWVALTLSDNGAGWPAAAEGQKDGTLGMHLVTVLAQQIRAELRQEGAQFQVLFKN
jgi:two-component sensor histidine kinase